MASKKDKVTEIRDFGDGKQIVIYTEDVAVIDKLSNKATRLQWYEQWHNCNLFKPKYVAVDLYFPKSKKTSVEKQIKRLGK